MGVTIAATRVACNTATGTQDITTSDLGGLTPKAALFFVSLATADNTAVDGAVIGWGATDGTVSLCQTAQDQHGVGTSNSLRKGEAIPVVIMDGSATNVKDGEAAFSAWITNGVRINWTNAPAAAYLLTAVFFAGTDLSAYCNYAELVTEDTGVDVTTVGFEADVLFTWLQDRSAGGSANATFGMGFVHNDRAGTVTQRAGYLRARDNVGTTDNTAQVRNDLAMIVGSNADYGIACDVSGFDSSGFTATPRNAVTGNPGTNEMGYLALRFGAGPLVSSKVYTYSTPTSTGDATDTNPGFEPQAVFYVTTLAETINTLESDADAGSIGVSVVTETAQYSNTVSSEDNVGDSNTQSLSDDQAVRLPLHGGAAGMAATYVGFTSTGVTLNWSDVESSARLYAALAIGAEAATAVSNPPRRQRLMFWKGAR